MGGLILPYARWAPVSLFSLPAGLCRRAAGSGATACERRCRGAAPRALLSGHPARRARRGGRRVLPYGQVHTRSVSPAVHPRLHRRHDHPVRHRRPSCPATPCKLDHRRARQVTPETELQTQHRQRARREPADPRREPATPRTTRAATCGSRPCSTRTATPIPTPLWKQYLTYVGGLLRGDLGDLLHAQSLPGGRHPRSTSTPTRCSLATRGHPHRGRSSASAPAWSPPSRRYSFWDVLVTLVHVSPRGHAGILARHAAAAVLWRPHEAVHWRRLPPAHLRCGRHPMRVPGLGPLHPARHHARRRSPRPTRRASCAPSCSRS